MSIRTASRLHLSPGAIVAALAVLLLGAAERAAAQTSPFLASGWAELRWRTDYNSARKEAAEKGLPLMIDFGTENCVFCRKLEATTFRDPRVATLMNNRFVLLKIDADREPALANHLNIRSYPTLYFADSTGKIINVVNGFKEADEFHEIIQASLSKIPPPDGLQQDYQAAVQQTQQRNYAAALPVFRDRRRRSARSAASAAGAEVSRAHRAAGGRTRRRGPRPRSQGAHPGRRRHRRGDGSQLSRHRSDAAVGPDRVAAEGVGHRSRGGRPHPAGPGASRAGPGVPASK